MCNQMKKIILTIIALVSLANNAFGGWGLYQTRTQGSITIKDILCDEGNIQTLASIPVRASSGSSRIAHPAYGYSDGRNFVFDTEWKSWDEGGRILCRGPGSVYSTKTLPNR